ncbi:MULTISPECIES: helix-turn-helix transcriptional regulator [unclassified Rhodococcus (in: high G+C Gram-positive bacteria)]|uniref:helix-turn-helix transcriptional regulator n=1 Tax=unclassified Rhodococcus (in: high G+C Gram-positive bacteria) TaxID=192944 RepID=UPI00051A5B24|nr:MULTISPECIES: helix-turn-helix transcriptional regulator [unclassified Rhodococcus (in: high G+C Gram-positive bacteria)]AOD23841.1 hypothetical protein IM25_21510 [Rhodococcus sp. p52]KHJ74683.1 hypothetical protein QR64_00430 [Rhodococcus sp. Chr-9]
MQVKDLERLKRERQRRGLAQWELAALVGCTQQTISLLETGKMANLSEELAMKIAKKLDASWDYLFVAHEVIGMTEVANGTDSNRQPVPA